MIDNFGGILIFSALVILVYKVLDEIRARKERFKIFKRGNVPEVPVANLLLGNLAEIFHPNNIEILDGYHEKLGDTFGTFYGPHPWVFTCDPELLQLLFVREADKFVNLNDYHLPYTNEVSKSLPQLRDREWFVMRKALNPIFSMKQMKSDNVNRDVEESTHHITKELIEELRVEKLNGIDGRIVDVLHLARRYSLSVLYRVAYSGDSQKDLAPESMDQLLEIVQTGSTTAAYTLPVCACIVLGDWSKRLFRLLLPFSPVWPTIEAVNRLIKESVRDRRESKERESRRTMVDTISRTVKEHGMGDDVLKSNLFLFFVAGYDTTASSIAALLWLLAHHPEEQEKLRASVIANGEASEYLTWCIMESLRLYPSVPTGIGRELNQDYHYNGMTFSKGTSIVGTTYTMHRLKKYWGDDADEFRPERHGQPMKHPFQYLPFGGGPRICIGMNLALIEIRNIISRIIIKYRLVKLPSTPEKLKLTSPNLFQLIILGKIEVLFVEVSKV